MVKSAEKATTISTEEVRHDSPIVDMTLLTPFYIVVSTP